MSFHTDIPKNFRRRERRATLPQPLLPAIQADVPPLYRTASHKHLPHLHLLHPGRVQSTPMAFSPKSTPATKIHPCHSHCTLPHLPGASRRRNSLPLGITMPLNSGVVKDSFEDIRRKSFPFAKSDHKKLHRCKALHRTHITFADIATELRSMRESKEQRASIKNVKSDPYMLSKSSFGSVDHADVYEKRSSRSFHSTNSSVLMVHHVDSNYARFKCSRINEDIST